MQKKHLQIEQLESRMALFSAAAKLPKPSAGWIKAIRSALGISMQQLANRLSVSKSSVHNMEKREIEGGITLKSLKEVARVLDMELVYGFVPKDGSLGKYIDRKSLVLAEKVVLRTSNNMRLEDQENSEERVRKAIKERAILIKQSLPKALWD